MFKKIISTALIIVFLFAITGCSDNNNNNSIIEETTTQAIVQTTAQSVTETATFISVTEQTTANNIQETTTIQTANELLSDNQIIEIYKSAAEKSNSTAKSIQKISMNDFSVDNGGAINSIMKMFLPVISKVVENNSTEFDGITGGYKNLSVDDTESVSYSKNGDNYNIKLKMKEQTDCGMADINSGTVGHAVSVIGDLSSVFNQLEDSGIPISVKNENIVMTYKNATVDVTIDNDGNILSGTWSYDVTLELNNFTVGGTTVPKASVIISNTITVN